MKTLVLILLSASLWTCSQPKPETAAAPETKPQPFEVGDSKYADLAKQTLYNLRDGNMDAYIANFSDNAKFTWNYLDSIQGKQSIYEYWKKRRDNVIDTLMFANEIWVPMKVNEPLAPGLPTGIWVFTWYKATARYASTGKSMTQWIHQVQHFDANDKIDYIGQYLDRVPIQAIAK